jgi:hypothetical protein
MKTMSRLLAAGAAVGALTGGALLSAPAANADTASANQQLKYPTMSVEAGAAARSAPYLNNTFLGWVTADPGSAYQASWVSCWKDGDWATGNYSSNRWFKAYVYHTNNPNAVWAFVHSSFVTNQSSVPQC